MSSKSLPIFYSTNILTFVEFDVFTEVGCNIVQSIENQHIASIFRVEQHSVKVGGR
jgi:hypothetical protein